MLEVGIDSLKVIEWAAGRCINPYLLATLFQPLFLRILRDPQKRSLQQMGLPELPTLFYQEGLLLQYFIARKKVTFKAMEVCECCLLLDQIMEVIILQFRFRIFFF